MDALPSYAAGLVDGEGCFSSYHNSSRAGFYSSCILVGMKERDAVEKLHNRWGGSLTQDKHGMWRWSLNKAADILRFIEDVHPHMIVKKKQAEVLHSLCYVRVLVGTRKKVDFAKRFYGQCSERLKELKHG